MLWHKKFTGLLVSGWKKKIKLRIITLKGVTSVCVAHIILLFYLHTFIYVTRLIGVIFEKAYCGPLNAFAKRHTLKGFPTLKNKDPKFAFSGMLRQCVWFYNYNCTFWHAVDIPSLDGAAKPWPRLFSLYLLLLWCCVSLPWWKKTTYAWDINYQCCISGATYFSAWGSPVGLFTSAHGLLITFHPHHYY